MEWHDRRSRGERVGLDVQEVTDASRTRRGDYHRGVGANASGARRPFVNVESETPRDFLMSPCS
jgi:hypothetical protein